jgi:hypothetical protein
MLMETFFYCLEIEKRCCDGKMVKDVFWAKADEWLHLAMG